MLYKFLEGFDNLLVVDENLVLDLDCLISLVFEIMAAASKEIVAFFLSDFID